MRSRAAYKLEELLDRDAILKPGMVVAEGVTTIERIPAGHKVAIKPIAVGEPVRR